MLFHKRLDTIYSLRNNIPSKFQAMCRSVVRQSVSSKGASSMLEEDLQTIVLYSHFFQACICRANHSG